MFLFILLLLIMPLYPLAVMGFYNWIYDYQTPEQRRINREITGLTQKAFTAMAEAHLSNQKGQ